MLVSTLVSVVKTLPPGRESLHWLCTGHRHWDNDDGPISGTTQLPLSLTLEANTLELNALEPETLEPIRLDHHTQEADTLELNTLEPSTLDHTLDLHTLGRDTLDS